MYQYERLNQKGGKACSLSKLKDQWSSASWIQRITILATVSGAIWSLIAFLSSSGYLFEDRLEGYTIQVLTPQTCGFHTRPLLEQFASCDPRSNHDFNPQLCLSQARAMALRPSSTLCRIEFTFSMKDWKGEICFSQNENWAAAEVPLGRLANLRNVEKIRLIGVPAWRPESAEGDFSIFPIGGGAVFSVNSKSSCPSEASLLSHQVAPIRKKFHKKPFAKPELYELDLENKGEQLPPISQLVCKWNLNSHLNKLNPKKWLIRSSSSNNNNLVEEILAPFHKIFFSVALTVNV